VKEPHLILTTIHRLRAAAVAPFFLSLRRTGFRGDLVVFASGVDTESVAQIRRWGARVECFRFRGKHVTNRFARLWPVWKLAFASKLPDTIKEKLAHQILHLFYRRHLLYLEFLRAHGSRYTRYLVTDCRDVFFQSDPFAWRQAEGLHVFLEEETARIGQCPHHIRWIRSQFGEETLVRLADHVVSCAGTVFGDRSSMESYLKQMLSLAMRAASLREADGDQGLHNFLIRNVPLARTTIHQNRRGAVMTVGAMQMTDLRLSPDHWIMNEENEIACIVHQYDRIPQLRELLLGNIQHLQ
jgi:hypothetical protein